VVATLLGIPAEGIANPVLRNSRGEEVGEIRVRGNAR
jgi:hypothetical protein